MHVSNQRSALMRIAHYALRITHSDWLVVVLGVAAEETAEPAGEEGGAGTREEEQRQEPLAAAVRRVEAMEDRRHDGSSTVIVQADEEPCRRCPNVRLRDVVFGIRLMDGDPMLTVRASSRP